MAATTIEGPPLPHLPPTNLTLPQFILDSTHPLRPVRSTNNSWFVDDASGASYHLEETRTRVYGLANALAARFGIGDGDVVCTFTPNDLDYPITMWAIHRLGAAVTPANPAYTADELVYQIQTANASLLICYVASLPVAEAAAAKAGLKRDRIVVLEGQHGANAQTGKSKYPYPSVRELVVEGLSNPPAFVEKRLQEGEGTKKIAYLCFSSGTTGKPKAVAIPHYSVISNVVQFASFNKVADPSVPYEKQRFRPGDVTLGVLPMYHIYAIVVVLHCTLFCGHTIVVFPKFAFREAVQSIVKYSITHLWIVPPVVVLFCKDQTLKRKDLAKIRYAMVGAAPLSPEVARQFVKVLPPSAVVGQGYGMTETSTVVCMQPLEVHQHIDGSAGRLISGTTIKVVDQDGKELGYDQPGELHVKGPQTMYNLYLNNPKANAETFYDGWVRTGDEVIVKKNGDIFIVDRLKEILKVKGFQVAPAELEGHLLDHPAVADAGVVGVPDEFCGEVPVAFIQLPVDLAKKVKSDPKVGEKLKRDIAKHVSDNKVDYKHLTGGVYFVDAIPKNPSGKILRRMLRDKAKGMNLAGPGRKAKL
ncbi:acetyl-CoA synthetase-like protein [Serendipita vermifera]|nr:acetyl-CoA synthetase-like protein [Serendipita vermifera]